MIAKADVKNIYPLSPMQEGMLFHALHDEGGAYIEQLSYRIAGNIDINIFRKSWEELVRRHDVLRTIFVHKDVPRPLQIVLKQWRVDFSSVDLRGAARAEAESRISVIKDQDRTTPFNLAKGPLMRVMVLSLSDSEAEVVWSHHHIILDGWSAGIVQGELLEIYAVLKQGGAYPAGAGAIFRLHNLDWEAGSSGIPPLLAELSEWIFPHSRDSPFYSPQQTSSPPWPPF